MPQEQIVLFLFMGESMSSNRKITWAEAEVSLLSCLRREGWDPGLLSLNDILGHLKTLCWPLDPPFSCHLTTEAHNASSSAFRDVQLSGWVMGTHICIGKGGCFTLDSSPPLLSHLTSSYWWWGSPSPSSTWKGWFKHFALDELCLWILSALHNLGFSIRSLWGYFLAKRHGYFV